MTKYLLPLFFVLTGCSMAPKQDIASLAPAPNTIKFSRYMITTICYKNNPKCIGPTVEDLEKANVELALAPFSKGDVKGFTAEDKTDLVEQTVPAHAEVRVTKNENEPDYHFYVMLRLGKGTKRVGKVKTFKIQDPTLLKEAKMVEDTMAFKGGTVKVELMLGPPMLITN